MINGKKSIRLPWVALLPICWLLLFGCSTKKEYKTDSLEVVPLTSQTYLHISYLQTQDFGRVACNGLIYINKGEAIIFDTPIDDEVSDELINWVEKELEAKVKAVVINHFHNDCLGGINAFHQRNIPSYAHQQTIELAKETGNLIPLNAFKDQLELTVGGQKVINRFFGAAHTQDNIVSFIPAENVLFGGCMIKSLNAGKGNLADADTTQWSRTVESIKVAWPNIQLVVPGHGNAGDVVLLDYTIQMFHP